MNLFGLEISVAKRDTNGGYVKKDVCFKVHDDLKGYLESNFKGLNSRIEDFQKAVMTYVDLLSKN